MLRLITYCYQRIALNNHFLEPRRTGEYSLCLPVTTAPPFWIHGLFRSNRASTCKGSDKQGSKLKLRIALHTNCHEPPAGIAPGIRAPQSRHHSPAAGLRVSLLHQKFFTSTSRYLLYVQRPCSCSSDALARSPLHFLWCKGGAASLGSGAHCEHMQMHEVGRRIQNPFARGISSPDA